MTLNDFWSGRVQMRPILRVYAPKEEYVASNVAMIREAVDSLFNVVIRGHRAIRSIDVRVWTDERYIDAKGQRVADCGKTVSALKEMFRSSVEPKVLINEVKRGDIFVSALNQSIVDQHGEGIKYSLILSKEAFPYVNSETLEKMFDAFCRKALVVPVAINELESSILDGRAANTFCGWDNEALLKFGPLFDRRSAKPMNGQFPSFKRGWSVEKHEWVYYHDAGVEEMLTIAHMFEELECPFIAPILPQGEGIKRYKIPDPQVNPDRYQQHLEKMGTKLERQISMLAKDNYDLNWLKDAVMPEYRKF